LEAKGFLIKRSRKRSLYLGKEASKSLSFQRVDFKETDSMGGRPFERERKEQSFTEHQNRGWSEEQGPVGGGHLD